MKANKYPLLICPKCGLELRPTMHGWAFASDKNTKCQPGVYSVFAHPFVVKKD